MADAFVCRREGHKPTVIFTNVRVNPPTDKPFSYFTTCRVCGRWMEFQAKDDPDAA